jgi:hypothetical protein
MNYMDIKSRLPHDSGGRRFAMPSRCLMDGMVVADFHSGRYLPPPNCGPRRSNCQEHSKRKACILSRSRASFLTTHAEHNQFSGAFLLSVICGDMQVHAAVMCARKACQFFECSLMHRRKNLCGSSWGSGCRSAVVKSCGGSRAPICASPECWHPRDRVPRDVDVAYRPNRSSWGDGPYGVLYSKSFFAMRVKIRRR